MWGDDYMIGLWGLGTWMAAVAYAEDKLSKVDKNAPIFEFDNGFKVNEYFINKSNIGSVFFLNSEYEYPDYSEFMCHTKGDKIPYTNKYDG